VILPPGVVIGNYCPPGHNPSEPLAFERSKKTFQPHYDKLAGHGITTREVESVHDDHVLPRLSPGTVSA
jgi:hypothetical protein